MKRHQRCIFIFVLIFLFSVSIFPVSAGTYEGDITNLLPAASYSVRIGGAEFYESSYPGGAATKGTSLTVKWDNSYASRSFDYIYLNIRSDKEITTVRFSDVNSSNGIVIEYVGMYDGLYQYRVPAANYLFTTFVVRVHTGSVTDANILIESCYGISDNQIPVQEFIYRSYRRYTDLDDNNKIKQEYVGGEDYVKLPYSYWSAREVYPIVGYEWNYSYTMIDLMPAFSTWQADSISDITLLFAASSIDQLTVSIVNGDVDEVIPHSLLFAGSMDRVPGTSGDDNYWNLDYFELSFDLTGIDLSEVGTRIRVTLYQEPWPKSQGYEFVYWQLYGAFYTPYNPDLPWYQTLWNWMKGGFDSVTDTLKNLLGDSSSGAVGEAADKMSQQADQMNSAQQSIDSVERPNIDPNQLFGSMLNFDSGGLNILSVMTSNQYVTSLLVVVFTFALAGFIFFGKRR